MQPQRTSCGKKGLEHGSFVCIEIAKEIEVERFPIRTLPSRLEIYPLILLLASFKNLSRISNEVKN